MGKSMAVSVKLLTVYSDPPLYRGSAILRFFPLCVTDLGVSRTLLAVQPFLFCFKPYKGSKCAASSKPSGSTESKRQRRTLTV